MTPCVFWNYPGLREPRDHPASEIVLQLLGMVLRTCQKQLSFVFSDLFQKSLDTHMLPKFWKTAEILPLPKKPKLFEMILGQWHLPP